MLDIKTRQAYLKALGYYNGKIDGIEGEKTKLAYTKLQNDYFTSQNDRDGKYDKNTDILLKNAYNVKTYTKNFNLKELKCGCKCRYCTGYPTTLNPNLLINMQTLRENYNKPITVTCGLRCSKYNKLVGGVSGSGHLKGNSADIYISSQSSTHSGRKKIVDYWDTLPNAKFSYCNGYMKYVGKSPTNYKSSTMGNATHVETL